MKIQIFVVKTEMPNAQVLERLRKSLVKMFHGLTIIPKATGYWVNDKGKEEKDKVEIWEIYTENIGFNTEEFMDIMKQIKTATKQSVQAVSKNNDLCFEMPIYTAPHEEPIQVLLGR
ncbi:MAG: hypothetical protein ABSB89_09080 [Candidatus Bathyarchaeia archaeon]|jgi:hypothetical protein